MCGGHVVVSGSSFRAVAPMNEMRRQKGGFWLLLVDLQVMSHLKSAKVGEVLEQFTKKLQ